jgi:hypothetical protein
LALTPLSVTADSGVYHSFHDLQNVFLVRNRDGAKGKRRETEKGRQRRRDGDAGENQRETKGQRDSEQTETDSKTKKQKNLE